ncbi:MAG: M15 family metallopeptidase, partial [Saprospiraceae bacterium]|nr:M15 family metallopeptidase [Saprospiraceae bacterium]
NTDRWSSHAYGAAIDINPGQNPYVLNPDQSDFKVFPSGGERFLDRGNIRIGMVEPIVHIFKKHGFTEWGGEWESPLDYHHFQVDWERILAR